MTERRCRGIAHKGPTMRHRYIIASAAILIAFGAKLLFFPMRTAEADISAMTGMGLDISQLEKDVKNLPAQQMHDMSFVFSKPAE